MFTRLREMWSTVSGRGEVVTIRFRRRSGSQRVSTYTYRLFHNGAWMEDGTVARHRHSAGWRALLRAVLRSKKSRAQLDFPTTVQAKLLRQNSKREQST
jgi:hypothetical protein